MQTENVAQISPTCTSNNNDRHECTATWQSWTFSELLASLSSRDLIKSYSAAGFIAAFNLSENMSEFPSNCCLTSERSPHINNFPGDFPPPFPSFSSRLSFFFFSFKGGSLVNNVMQWTERPSDPWVLIIPLD